MKISSFYFQLSYNKGTSNVLADYWSRNALPVLLDERDTLHGKEVKLDGRWRIFVEEGDRMHILWQDQGSDEEY